MGYGFQGQDHIIISPEGSISYGVVNASKYLGLSSYKVLIPAEQFRVDVERITLPGASKDALREMPEFGYAKDAGQALK